MSPGFLIEVTRSDPRRVLSLLLRPLTPSLLSLSSAPCMNSIDTSSFSASQARTNWRNQLDTNTETRRYSAAGLVADLLFAARCKVKPRVSSNERFFGDRTVQLFFVVQTQILKSSNPVFIRWPFKDSFLMSLSSVFVCFI